MEASDWELIHKAIHDAVQWVKEAPTEDARQYRIGVMMSAMNGTMEPQINEEYDTGEDLPSHKC